MTKKTRTLRSTCDQRIYRIVCEDTEIIKKDSYFIVLRILRLLDLFPRKATIRVAFLVYLETHERCYGS